ncbi:MAG: ParB/RepB/Spo0J family partition protein [bacterium]
MVKNVKIEALKPNPYQPRKYVYGSKMQEITASIKKHGMLQPILVRFDETDGMYQIIAGERRYRAAIEAGLKEVPVIEKETDEREMLEIALIENLHREDISPIEKAEGFRSLMKDFDMTQREIAESFGMSRPAIANTLRLLDLPESVKTALRKKEITEGHARALLGLKSETAMKNIIKRICSRGMTVRECEDVVRFLQRGGGRNRREGDNITGEERDIMEFLSERFGTRVKIVKNGRGGRVEIEFYDREDLERIIEIFETQKART